VRLTYAVALAICLPALFLACAPLPECFSGHVEQQTRLIPMRGQGWVSVIEDIFVCDVRFESDENTAVP
jgi:hypothetical protein